MGFKFYADDHVYQSPLPNCLALNLRPFSTRFKSKWEQPLL